MKIKALIAAFLAALLVVVTPLTAMAEDSTDLPDESNRMPEIDENQELSLTVNFGVDKENTAGRKGIDGAEFTIYKIADLQVHGGSADYTMKKEYQHHAIYEDDREVTFNGMSAKESAKLASELAKEVKDDGVKLTTNADGNATFKLNKGDAGMYLIVETSKTGTADKYETVSPFLISAPLAFDGTWTYDVVVQPKTAPKLIPIHSKVNTSVVSYVVLWSGLALIAAAVCIVTKISQNARGNE